MSMFSSSAVDLLLLLLLLCHSMHACEGRRLGGSVNKDSRKHVHHSINKDVEKTILEKTLISSKKNPCLSEELSMRKQRVTDDQNQVGAIATATSAQKTTKNPQKAMLNDKVDQETKRNNPGFVHQIESLVVSVSWRVPKKKHNEHPGNEIVMFSDVGLQQSTKIEGVKVTKIHDPSPSKYVLCEGNKSKCCALAWHSYPCQGLPPLHRNIYFHSKESERRGRSLLGSESHNSEETIDSKKDDDVEDVGVMDYQQPRRKPPIHNFSP